MEKNVDSIRGQGYSCSQTMMMMAMDKLGVDDGNLVKSMKGLAAGMGIRHACGIVTGAACAFALADEKLGPAEMFPEFHKWFYETYGEEAGGIGCAELLHGDFENRKQYCTDMIRASWDKADEILTSNGFGSGENA